MNFVDFVFFFYVFVGLYMLSLMILICFHNRKKMFDYSKGKPEPVSIVLPCYNEGKTIGKAIESLLSLDYPKNMLEIIIVDDKSTDNSVEIIRSYLKKNKNIKLIINKRNSGKAAEPTNIGIKAAKYDLVALTDSDSFPEKDVLLKMIGLLQKDKKVAGVTCAVLAKKPRNFIEKLQVFDYIIIAFTRKLLDFIDSIYVIPGPFALYRKKILFEVGLFDTKNLTQDIEIVWRLMAKGYKVRMALSAKVYTILPKNFKQWWDQRVRWGVGGTQTLWKYRSWCFKKNMLGMFVIPFFSASLFMGFFSFGLFIYLFLRRFFLIFLATKYSVAANTALLTLQELSFSPSILNFFGITLFLLGTFYTLFIISIMREWKSKYVNLYNLTFYLTIYLLLSPLVLIHALYKIIKKDYSW